MLVKLIVGRKELQNIFEVLVECFVNKDLF